MRLSISTALFEFPPGKKLKVQPNFLAALPKKDRLEIHFSLNRKLDHPRITQAVALSATNFINCLDLHTPEEIDGGLLSWLSEAYHLRDKR